MTRKEIKDLDIKERYKEAMPAKWKKRKNMMK